MTAPASPYSLSLASCSACASVLNMLTAGAWSTGVQQCCWQQGEGEGEC
jgi:hypothetical protein